ncbi:MAG: AIM24 family protein [Elusimicrobia bacterium]|nr:AIM24 family protein [Elusimicrobiota bacterium]
MSEGKTWFLFVRGAQEGPMTREELIERLEGEERTSDILVISSGSSEPERAASFFERVAAEEEARGLAKRQRLRDLEYTLLGDDLQLVEIWLDPGESVFAELDSMMYMESGIQAESRADEDPGDEPFLPIGFTNVVEGKRKAAFSPLRPGRILRMDLRKCGGEFFCRRDAILCASKGVKLAATLDQEGVILARLKGGGSVFIHAGGMVVSKDLKAGESLRADAGCVLAFTKEMDCDISRVQGPAWAALKGPGRVWLQAGR